MLSKSLTKGVKYDILFLVINVSNFRILTGNDVDEETAKQKAEEFIGKEKQKYDIIEKILFLLK